MLGVLVLLGSAACEETLLQQGPPNLTLEASADSELADGVTRVNIEAVTGGLPDRTAVKLTTSLGELVTTTQRGDSVTVVTLDDSALAGVVSREPGLAVVTAVLGSATATDSIQFLPALPTRIELFADRVSVPANGTTSATITAVLRREVGKVSTGLDVRFVVTNEADGRPIPGLEAVVKADSAGVAQTTLASATALSVRIVAVVHSQASDAIVVTFTS